MCSLTAGLEQDTFLIPVHPVHSALLLDRGCFNPAQPCWESKAAAGKGNCTRPSLILIPPAHGRCFPGCFPQP